MKLKNWKKILNKINPMWIIAGSISLVIVIVLTIFLHFAGLL